MNENQVIEWIAALLMLFGAVVSVISALGMIRLPDVYTRSHAATKSATLSVLCCLLGAFIYFWSHDGFVSIRLILGIIFTFIPHLLQDILFVVRLIVHVYRLQKAQVTMH